MGQNYSTGVQDRCYPTSRLRVKHRVARKIMPFYFVILNGLNEIFLNVILTHFIILCEKSRIALHFTLQILQYDNLPKDVHLT